MALTGEPAGAQTCDPRQLTCITPLRFLVRAYNGTVVRNGGKCLDYGAEVSGSPVFLNDCAVAHPIGVYELQLLDGSGQPIRNNVLLVAGTKVIGLKRSPISTIGDGGPPAFVAPSEIALELQNVAGSDPGFGAVGPSLADQTFALDGDSIILAANRDLVAKVQNARGRNGTPIVVGERHLAHAELWEFHATDGSGDDPTDAFITIVPTFTRLGQYLGPNAIFPVQFGTVFKFQEEVIIFSEGEVSPSAASGGFPFPELRVPAGVTIRGDRRGTLFGPEFWMPTGYEGSMFVIAGSGTRITGLRIRGTNVARDQDEELKHIRTQGIHAPEEHARTIIDHNDISDWSWAGVRAEGEETGEACSQNASIPPQTRPNNVQVLRNFLHHHVVSDRGYGVNANSGGFPLIEGNTFLSNRHAIAGTNSTTNTGYRAWSNLVLSHSPLQHGIFHTHDFDMHGTGDNGFCGIAGGYMDLFANTFLGSNRVNFKLRGTNCQSIDIRNNVFLQDEGDAIEFDNILYPWESCSSTARFNTSQHPEQFDRDNPTGRLGVGDFDGDGLQDLFLATGTAFYYAPGGSAEWRLLTAGRSDQIQNLLFGDFDADGRTDVLGKNGGNLMVSWGGISEWERLNSTNAAVADLAVGNFDGLPGDDIFHANGRDWFVSSGGSGEFLLFNTSGFRVRNLRFGDFDGLDGKTDVFGVVSGSWSVSYGATSAWTPLRPRLTDTVNGLFVADFNGDGRDDIGQANFTTLGLLEWRFSHDGVGNWISITNAFTGPTAGIGRFRGDPTADVLVWDPVLPFPFPSPGNGLDLFYFGSGGLQNHSRQDMR